MELVKYYSLDESYGSREIVLDELDHLVDEDKIEYNLVNYNVIKIKDIDLSDKEIGDIANFLESNDVYPYLDGNDEVGFFDDDFMDIDD